MKTIATYGTLRKGDYNYQHYDMENTAEFVGKGIINRYVMYNLGGYPAIYPSEEDSIIVVEVYKISDNIYNQIDELERAYNYYAKDVDVYFNDKVVKAVVYIYKTKLPDTYLLESGDWMKR